MVLLHQISHEMMEGYNERELLMKRFIFRKTGKVFVYYSSVPDDIYETPDDMKSRNVERYTNIMELMCFETIGKDVIITRIS